MKHASSLIGVPRRGVRRFLDLQETLTATTKRPSRRPPRDAERYAERYAEETQEAL